ncbi:MAG: hypothetical protein KGR48_01080 [Alphaproteobacteria bacterium]|nr:hypothetical protein [Alphaproteobacteria bacterium]MBU6471210.1 hypothetical protein [Alphaproteobacteria bacterium]MDE2012167.1 hypothetical protein [Alphaproteobacteria bacterium]MDE2072180.1 hypothetical protein [Alphaproteobacteria bacterium]MDE2353159.1 hypothetical protein [Alphaproteobacteria bacterium]
MISQPDMGRLTCFISEVPETNSRLPDDEHAFWRALDSLADALIAVASRYCGTVEDPACDEFRRSSSLLWFSSDTPEGALYFWIPLPLDARFQRAVIEAALSHLTEARRALPGVYWDVCLADRPLAWDAGAASYMSP